MGCTDDTPLLPGDWGAVDQERESILRARRLQAERDLARTLLAEFEDWLRKDECEPDEVITFRQGFYQSWDLWAAAAFELTEAVLCSPTPVASVPALSLEPVFTRSHGSL
ncbi:MAG TPA: hypothetical protein VK053_17450 [Jiangellaceae bacterium]|nr:hypothetical protein [Jiangellaceae bacterium]